MKKILMVTLLSIGIAGWCFAEPSITEVTAQQRYPWNGKVDISYTAIGVAAAAEAKGLLPAVKVMAIDRSTVPWATNVAVAAALFVGPLGTEKLTDAVASADGAHRIVWDMAAQGLAFKSEDMVFAVSGEGKSGGVQLWEGGPYWAECNVGATKPEEYGYYFWWGDTVGYKRNAAGNGWISVKDGSSFTFTEGNCPTKYKDNSQLQSAGYIDSTGNLVAAHDAATVHLGAPWRMPTDAEFAALISNCDTSWTQRNGVWGRLVKGRGAYASKSIFFPAAGDGYDSHLDVAGSYGYYWASTPTSDYSICAWYLVFGSSDFRRSSRSRCSGQSVRPVRGFAHAETFCTGESGQVRVDLTMGKRAAAKTERLTYSTEWNDAGAGAVAVVSVDGEVISEKSGSGTVEWTPTRNGTYELTHKVMDGGVQVGETLTATFLVEGLHPEVPVINPASGTTFDTSLTVSMTCASKDAAIHYTKDGTTPTMESTAYKGKFKIYGKTTVKAIAFWEDGTPSEMVMAEYAKGQCEEPSVAPPDGTVFEHSGQVVSLAHDNPEGVLRYTIDGSDPTAESPEYTEPFTIDETTVVKAKVFGDQYFDSSIVTATLTRVWLKVATPEVVAETQFTGSKAKVVLACDTEDALIRYTTNGQDPNSHSTKYKGPFYVTDTTTVKAYATKADYTNSDIAALTITKVWGIGDTMGKPDHTFETGGDKGFVRVEDKTATLGESMKSGAIADSEKSILSTTVIGPGTLTFKWKASCEEDDEYEWDHGEFRVNGGAPKAWINGVTDWIEVSQRIDGEGTNTVTWTYVKDDVESVGQDCIWVSDYVWKSDYTTTQTTEVPVPYDWLKEKSRDIVDEYENYEKVAKQAAYNPRFTVEQCYVAGLDPESTTNEFTAGIVVQDGVPVVTWNPDLGTMRDYKVWGKETLEDAGDWQYPTNSTHRFFKVTVEMP